MDQLSSALQVLSAMITPAVLISACGMLVLSTSNRLVHVVVRVRDLSNRFERLAKGSKRQAEKRSMIISQLELLTSRARFAAESHELVQRNRYLCSDDVRYRNRRHLVITSIRLCSGHPGSAWNCFSLLQQQHAPHRGSTARVRFDENGNGLCVARGSNLHVFKYRGNLPPCWGMRPRVFSGNSFQF